ncbi:MAG TPA: DUF2461 domain-containing protein [Candidatus Kapabacteria bacterium]|jgi:uncharacterized protein (TIGR02453 family)|nr:DUF2461 domain-containing protein [Candidatus Kapabacteria bacterium]
MIHSYFKGFSPDILKFLQELSANNTRDWFAEHRDRYDSNVRLPAKQLIATMADRFDELHIHYKADDKTSMFRIHRDTRFSKDKSPYKTNVGVFFPFIGTNTTAGKPVERPGIYCHIEPGNCAIGGGIYMPTSDQLKAIRARIYSHHEEWYEIIHSRQFTTIFATGIHGESLKTMPRGYELNHAASEYIRKKQWYVWETFDESVLFTEEIIDILEEKSIASLAFHEFLSGVYD